MTPLYRRLLLVVAVTATVIAIYASGLTDMLTLANLQAKRDALTSWANQNVWLAGAIFFGVYVLMAALSINHK